MDNHSPATGPFGMVNQLLDAQRLLGVLDPVERVLASLDDENYIAGQLIYGVHTVSRCEDPPVVEDTASAKVLERDQRREASLKRHLVGKFAGLGVMAAHDSVIRG